MTTNISRRRFLAYFGIGVGSAVALAAAPSVWEKLSGWAKGLFVSREEITLADVASRTDPDGECARIADILNQRNEIIDDASSIWLVSWDEKCAHVIVDKDGKWRNYGSNKIKARARWKALNRSHRNQPGNAWAS